MRFNHVLSILKEHLENYDDIDAVAIANAGNPASTLADNILISLIKIEEENALRNGKHHKISQNFKTVYKNRLVFANLFVLFASNHGDYKTSLIRLSQVVEFFQGKNVFTHLDGYTGGASEKFKIIVELVNLSFEQMNYIWSFLGGTPKPSVFYKIRLIPLEAKNKQTGEGEPIFEINLEGNTTF